MKKLCLKCKTPITYGRADKLYCNRSCKNRASSQKQRQKIKSETRSCLLCGSDYRPCKPSQKFCSRKCGSESRKAILDIPSSLALGSRKVDKRKGYIYVYAPYHPKAGSWGYVYEHRLVIEKSLGRYLETEEHVHHRNGKRWDNRLCNLEVLSASDHAKLRGQRTGDLLI